MLSSEITYGAGICPVCDRIVKLAKDSGLIAYHVIEGEGICKGVGQEPMVQLSLQEDSDAYYY